MFGRLMPRQGRFFDLFNEHAEQIVEGSRELASLMTNHDDLERRTYTIESIEKRADKITRTTIELLHKTFITPIDREDIHQLISKMDDILDLIEDSAQLMFLYDVRDPTPEAKKLADICVVCCEKVKSAVARETLTVHAVDHEKPVARDRDVGGRFRLDDGALRKNHKVGRAAADVDHGNAEIFLILS